MNDSKYPHFGILLVDDEQPPLPSPERNPFTGFERLPTFSEAADLLVEEAMARADGNQTLAARLLGITQPALSKRVRMKRG